MHLRAEVYLPGVEASGDTVRVGEPVPGVRVLTLNRPSRLNAMSAELTGRLVDAAEADRTGLVNRVVPDGEVLDAALATAAQITANSPMGVWMTKEVAWSQLEIGSLQAGIDLENRTQIMTTFTRDHREQIGAFLEKRPAEYANE